MVVSSKRDGGVFAEKGAVSRAELQGELRSDFDVAKPGDTFSAKHGLGPFLTPDDGKRDVASGLHGLLRPDPYSSFDLGSFADRDIVGDDRSSPTET